LEEEKMKSSTLADKRFMKIDWRRLQKDLIRDRYLYLLLLPFVAYYVIFMYAPMSGIQLAFKDFSAFRGLAGSPWVGFKHFIRFFTSPFFYRIVRNTFIISFYGLVFGFPIPIILALLLNEVTHKRYQKFVQTATYLPHFVSVVIVAGLVVNFLSPSYGIVNRFIQLFGADPIYFLSKKEFFRPVYISMGIWQETGFGAIIYLAALASVDPQLYEAAMIDGAGKWHQMRHITLPGMLPTIVIMLILRIGRMLTLGYESIILLYQPATYETADIISTYVYRMGLLQADYSLATVVGLFNGLVSLVLVLGVNKISKKVTDIGLW
jgi:putative aldouronate transport system permease protein